jgi:uncharacterized membrane protein (UPF0127 family)
MKNAKISFFLTCLLLLARCVPATEKAQPKLETMDLYFLNAAGGQSILKAELARTDGQKAKGLMFRKEIGDGEGMLFVYERDQILSFWMKNTELPLSIAFISADGRVLETRDMEPQSLLPVRSARSARYALEVPRGWFDSNGVESGAISPAIRRMRQGTDTE